MDLTPDHPVSIAAADSKNEETKTERVSQVLADAFARLNVKAEHLGPPAQDKPDALTEKKAPAFSTTKSACLDLFFGTLVRDADRLRVDAGVETAWKESPETLVKILLHCRDARSGKGEKTVSHYGLLWLREHKPLTYLSNLQHLLSYGCYKDLLVLASLAESQGLTKLGLAEYVELEVLAETLDRDRKHFEAVWARRRTLVGPDTEKAGTAFVEAMDSEASSSIRKRKAPHNEKVLEAIQKVPCHLTLAAKWAPRESGLFDKDPRGTSTAKVVTKRKPKDKKTRVQTGKPGFRPTQNHHFPARLAALLFPKVLHPLKPYRKLVSALCEELRVVEQYMCGDQWDKIAFEQVPAKAAKLYRKAFGEHEKERYATYLEEVKSGKKEIKTSGVHPNEIVRHFLRSSMAGEDGTDDTTLELQWQTLIKKLAESGKFKRSLAICDVSGSMAGEPLEVSVALGLVISELSEPPFRNRLITFSSDPKWHVVKGDNLRARVHNLEKADWTMSTAFDKVFQLILKTAVEKKLKPEDMPQSCFVFSDMQFDSAAGASYNQTVYQKIAEDYRKAGYAVPLLIFWNLRATHPSFPVQADTPNVAMLSGFSAELLKVVMSAGSAVNGETMMLHAISPYPAVIVSSEI